MTTLETQIPHLETIRRYFPDLVITSVRTNTEGLVNDVVILNDQWVCRLPKGDSWQQVLLANEVKVLELVRQHVDIDVPVYEIVAADFVAYHFIPGQALLRNTILAASVPVQKRLAEQIGAFLKQLHTIPMAEVAAHQIGQSDTNRSRETFLTLYEDVQQELFPLMMTHTKRWVHHHFRPIMEDAHFLDYEPTLMNGDLGPYHILCNEAEQRIRAIIDFGTAGIGDPAVDLCCLIDNYGESFLRQVIDQYPQATEMVQRARFWAGTLSLQWALQGVRSKDPSWFLVHISGARDVMPVQ